MARKRIDVNVPAPGAFSHDYYAVARDETRREVPYAYGRDSRDAKAKVAQKVRSMYGWEAEILY